VEWCLPKDPIPTNQYFGNGSKIFLGSQRSSQKAVVVMALAKFKELNGPLNFDLIIIKNVSKTSLVSKVDDDMMKMCLLFQYSTRSINISLLKSMYTYQRKCLVVKQSPTLDQFPSIQTSKVAKMPAPNAEPS
jgi:hypothetical protein